MSAEKMLTSITQSRAPATMYGYPATALVAELGNGSNYIHIIYGSGDAGDTPGSLYDNAPNGSLYIPLTATAGNKKLYVKFGAKGLIDGTWQSESAAAYVPYTGATANVDIGTFRFFALKFTARRDNGAGVSVSGPSAAASASAGADILNYEGIFYNDDYNNAVSKGTKKNRNIYGTNYDMDLELQTPHQLRLVAADNTVTGGDADLAETNGVGVIYLISRSSINLSPWAAAEAVGDRYVVVTAKTETVFDAGTGTYNGGQPVIKANSGSIFIDQAEFGSSANGDSNTNGRIAALKFTGRRDNGAGLAVKGPSDAASASAGADVSNYEGIFYNATFNDATNAGTKKNRCIIGGNLDVDMEIQGPHMVRITAADNTVVDGDPDAAVGNGLGIVQVLSQSKMEFCPWAGGAAPHAATAQYLILTSKNETVFTVGTGTYTGGDIVLKTNTGLLYVNGEALAYSGKLSQASTNAPTVAGAKNNTGQTATFGYVSPGNYTLTFGAAIAADADHVQVQITNGLTGGNALVSAYASSNTVIQIRSFDVATLVNALADALVTGASIRVTVTE